MHPSIAQPTHGLSLGSPRPAVTGIVLPPLTGDTTAHGSSRSESPSSASPGGSGDAESAAIDAAINAAQAGEEAPGNGGSHGWEGKGASKGGSKESKDVVDAIASGMQCSGMQPGMVRPPAMVTGGRGAGWC